MPRMLACPLQPTGLLLEPPRTRARIAAILLDAALGAGLALLTGAIATTWLLVRTRAGALDAGAGDAAVGLALVLASVPAWLTWLAFDLASQGATPGQRARGLVVRGRPHRRALRLLVHPLGSVGWLWLALVTWLALLPALTLLFASIAIVVIGSGITSLLLAVRTRGSRAIHDRIVNTRLSKASPGAHAAHPEATTEAASEAGAAR